MSDAWSTVEQFARYYGRAWPQHAARHSPLGYRFSISRARPARPPYADWPAVVRYAHAISDSGGYVDTDWLAAMAWYADARLVTPDYLAARSSTDERLRALALRDKHRYSSILAPLLPWHTLDCAPTGGRWDEARWDEARWVRLLHDNGGPYAPLLKPI